MLNLVGIPSSQEFLISRFLGVNPSFRISSRSSALRVRCTPAPIPFAKSSTSSSPALTPFSSGSGLPSQQATANGARRPSTADQVQQRSTGSSPHIPKVASVPRTSYPDDASNGAARKVQDAAYPNGSVRVECFAKGKWQKKGDSSLSGDEPLPLPMTWPDSKPAGREVVEKMLNCDVTKEDCKSVVYQWTGDCTTCQGTGLVSFYRKRHEVISKCINCLGLGSVHKITSRGDIQKMEDDEESTNENVYKGPSTNGRSPSTNERGPSTNGKA